MKILLASSEVYPYSKTGGLADMVGALARALAQAGHMVGMVTPLYQGIRERFKDLAREPLPLEFPLGQTRVTGEVLSLQPAPNLTLYFIDQPGFFQRSGLYQLYGVDYPDNSERFVFFAKAIAHLALHLPWKPDVVHLNDWQTGLAALFLYHQRHRLGWPQTPPACFTIHNLAYQGLFPTSQYALTNLPWDYFVPDGVEFYGQLNCLKGGLVFSNLLTTVSPRYAREITTEEFGCGLDGLLRARADALVGVLNGVDYEDWNTDHNPHLPSPYDSADLSGKAVCKKMLQIHSRLPVRADVPLFASIGRLVLQKGVDIMLAALERLAPAADFQFVLLGTGDPGFQKEVQLLMNRYPDKISATIGYNEAMSHQIEAGADFFLMPSQFEPCGLNQMYSLRYGTIPIVRVTGGLDDSVIDLREDPVLANGIKFQDHTSGALEKAVQKALALYQQPDLMTHFIKNAMTADFSWKRTAKKYEEIYRLTQRR